MNNCLSIFDVSMSCSSPLHLVHQSEDTDGDGSIDVQEFAGLIRDAYTTGERSRIIYTQQGAHATHHLHDMCAKEEVSSMVAL